MRIFTSDFHASSLSPSLYSHLLRAQSGPLGGFLLILNTVIVWMKLISYAHTNYDMRLLLASGEQVRVAAPCITYYQQKKNKRMLIIQS